MVNKMIMSNILHRPVRTAVSVLAVAIEVAMVMLVVGLTHGLVQDTARRTEGVGADVMVQPSGASFLFGLSSAPMTLKIGDRLEQVPHVLAVTPVLFLPNAAKGLNVIWGIDMPSFVRVSGGFVYHAGGPFTGPHDVLVDDIFAKAERVKVNETLNVLNNDFRVAGIVEHGKGGRVFIPLQTAEELGAAQDKASIFFVKCTERGYTDDVVQSIRELFPKNQILRIQDYMSMMTSNNLPGLDYFNTAMISIAISIGFLVIFLSMYTTITERTREIGILKSLGATKGYIIAVVLREAGILCVAGILTGCVGAVLARKAILEKFPSLVIELTVHWAFIAAALAFLGSQLGAFYPALRAAQLDPVDALAYE